jgi:hypothetical protein
MPSSPLTFTTAIGAIFLALAANAAEPIDFAHDIVPLLRKHCGQCHTGDHKKGGYSMNTRASVIAGGEGGAAVVPGNSGKSEFVSRVLSRDKDEQMPPEGPRLTEKEVALLKNWIDAGLPWQEGFALKPPTYEPPLKPRHVELPSVVASRTNPVDRLVDTYFSQHKVQRPPQANGSTLVRRLSLDLTGLLPAPERVQTFINDQSSEKRDNFIRELLSDDVAYAEHWLTFWNDLLRNDYAGTGFITGGRKQITGWLYRSLVDNKPYDQMVRELIAPTDDSEGFIQGIKWRGTVNASQTIEVQFAQNISQAFLGINMKCASCHDSFIDRWKLSEAYGLAAIYATQSLAIHRCDKPTGAIARAAWIFPELGQIDADAPAPKRLEQLAGLMTHPENGRFTRTIVNRLWHRLMGRGIVHPVDAMHSEPWSADLLDWLAADFAAHNYDLKHTLALIATSDIYQAQTPPIDNEPDADDYIFRGPHARRMTAEQFVDCVWQITDAAPSKTDAQVVRAALHKPDAQARGDRSSIPAISAQWIWSSASQSAPANQSLTFRRQFKLSAAPRRAVAVVTSDNEYRLLVNGREIEADDNWETAELVSLDSSLKAGDNEILVVCKNTGNSPNAAGLIFQASIHLADGAEQSIASNEEWEWTTAIPDAKGRFPNPDDAAKDGKARGKRRSADWEIAAIVPPIPAWTTRVADSLPALLHQGTSGPIRMVRASLLKSNDLQRALGRPNRDQIVSMRPSELTTLEAISLANGETLATTIEKGAAKWLANVGQASSLPYKPEASAKDTARRGSPDPAAIVNRLYLTALSRVPTADELAAATYILSPNPTSENIQDLLWSVIMLPEFQLVR